MSTQSEQVAGVGERIARIVDDGRGRLEVQESVNGIVGEWEITAAPEYLAAMGEDGRRPVLTFRETTSPIDGTVCPGVQSIQNPGRFAGWGSLLVEALLRGYPETPTWVGKPTYNGASFWVEMERRHGLALVLQDGRHHHWLKAGDDAPGSPPEHTGTVADVDAAVDRARHLETLSPWARRREVRRRAKARQAARGKRREALLAEV